MGCGGGGARAPYVSAQLPGVCRFCCGQLTGQPCLPASAARMRPSPTADLIRHLNDPEHPLTLEQLKVTRLEHVSVDHERSMVDISFTPTIPHCSMATLIGLCIRVKLLRSLPPRFKVNITITPGSHSAEAAVNKQLNDKERVAAALENTHLLDVVNKCLHVPRASS